MKNRQYNVAGHSFSVSLPDSSPLWDRMDNYSPFLDESSAPSVFSVTEVQSLPETDLTPILTKDNVESDAQETSLCLYRTAMGYRISFAPNADSPICGWMDMSEDMTEGLLYIVSKNPGGAKFALDNAIMLLFAFRTATMGTLEMHSSTVVLDGKAYMFLGKSGTGKSTHSRLWMENIPGTWLLNDDNPVVRVHDDGKVTVYGTPWSGKTPCYKNLSAEVAAIVQLKQAPFNRIGRLSLPMAYAALYSSSSGFHANRTMADGLFDTMSAVLTSVPVSGLECLPNADAALLCREKAAYRTSDLRL